jgi:hypothetical protein
MAALTIKDLHKNLVLDRKAMSVVRGGGGAAWIFGAFRPYVAAASGGMPGSSINLFQTNNFSETNNLYQTNTFFVADQMNNQVVSVDVRNSAANSVINALPMVGAFNGKQ